ncbi:protein kinase, partial [Myxococcota bacterium]|nr:protein kinase [Myxococcota bacterium]
MVKSRYAKGQEPPRTFQGYAPASGQDPLLGQEIGGRYRLEAQIGRGGMGVVYRALDERLHGRRCAVKILTISYGEQDIERFQRESRLIARLTSPHTVRIYDVGELPDHRPYIVMELLEGRPLSALTEVGAALPARDVVALAKGILSALVEAHGLGIIHRDLKPANVFLLDAPAGLGYPKILDFGIAKELEPEGPSHATTVLVGTPAYMSPEQFARAPLDGRADLYALGVLLYELCAGHGLFDETGQVPEALQGLPPEFQLGWQHLNQAPAPIPGLPDALWVILSRLLAKAPERRFSDAQAALQALSEINLDESAHDIELDALKPRTSNGAGWLGLGVGLALLIGGGLWWALTREPPPDAPRSPPAKEIISIGAAQPGAAQPDAAQPDAAQPDAAQPDAARPPAAIKPPRRAPPKRVQHKAPEPKAPKAPEHK